MYIYIYIFVYIYILFKQKKRNYHSQNNITMIAPQFRRPRRAASPWRPFERRDDEAVFASGRRRFSAGGSDGNLGKPTYDMEN